MPSFTSKIALAGAILASKAAAHGIVQAFATDGQYQEGYVLNDYYTKQNTGEAPAKAGWYEEATDNGFVAPSAYGEADIICHKNAENAAKTGTVAAGGKVDFFWTAWPESHFGPVLTYVANCGTADDACSTVDKTTLKWVKIDEAGIDLDTQTWAAEDMIANNNTWTVTVPESLAPGPYVFRHEIIAMHGASSEGGAQNYPFCINIAITGSGTESPEGTLGTELYTSTDPGILFNPYTTLTEYTIPGPALFGSGSTAASTGSSTGGSSNSTTPATPTGSGASPSAAATGSADAEDEESSCTKARRHARDLKRRN